MIDDEMQYMTYHIIRTHGGLAMNNVMDCHMAVNPKQPRGTPRLPMSHWTTNFFQPGMSNAAASVAATPPGDACNKGMVTAVVVDVGGGGIVVAAARADGGEGTTWGRGAECCGR